MSKAEQPAADQKTNGEAAAAAAAEKEKQGQQQEEPLKSSSKPQEGGVENTSPIVISSNSKLNAKWTMWFDNPRLAPAGSDWKDNLKVCGSFDTIESFWRTFNNLKPASELSMNSNYSVFRFGVEPSWEDPSNCDGGKFVLTIPKKNSKAGKCDEWWLFTVLAIVGETMDATGDQVNGAVVSIRKHQDRIALWLKSSDQQICVSIGERWKKALTLEKTILRYQTHRDAAASGRSFRNEVQFEV